MYIGVPVLVECVFLFPMWPLENPGVSSSFQTAPTLGIGSKGNQMRALHLSLPPFPVLEPPKVAIVSMQATSKLLSIAERKKVKRMLYKMNLNSPDTLKSNTFYKVEAGIPRRRLWPVDIESSDVLSYIEHISPTRRGPRRLCSSEQVH